MRIGPDFGAANPGAASRSDRANIAPPISAAQRGGYPACV